MPVNKPIFEPAAVLPRGPHELSRTQVRESQALRLCAAIASLVAETGYPAVTIRAIARHAGVSRATFYQHYENKQACYLDAYERFGNELFNRLVAAVPADAHWREIVNAVLTRYLATLDGDRTAARAFVLEIDGAGPAARAEGRKLYARMARFVQWQHEQAQRQDTSLYPLPPEAYVAMTHGIRGLVRDVLDAEPQPRLTELAPGIRQWVDIIFGGAKPASDNT